MRRRRIALGVAANAYGRVLLAGVQLAMVPLLVLHWGIHLYGCWIVLSAVPGLLALGDLGFGGAAFVRMTALVARGERDAAVAVLHTAVQAVALISAATLAIGLAVLWAVPDGWLPSDPALDAGVARATLALLMLYALTVFQGTLQSASYASVGQFPLFTFASSNTYLLENALLAAAVVTGHGPIVAAAALLTGRVVGLAATALLLRRRAPWLAYGIARADGGERRALARSAAGMLAVPLGQAAALQGAVVALGAVAGPAATPAFAAARTLARVGLQATNLVVNALAPEFAAAQARDDRRGLAVMLVTVVAAALAVAVPFALAIAVGGEWVLALWTRGAVTATPGLMPAVALATVLGALWMPLSTLMCAVDRQGSFAWAYLLLGAVAIGMTLALARPFGATGAAWAAVALDAGILLVIGRFAWRHWFTRLPMGAAVREVWARGWAMAGRPRAVRKN